MGEDSDNDDKTSSVTKTDISNAFKRFDKDNSGFLEKDEAVNALNTLCSADKDDASKQICADVKKTLNFIDANKDGKISVDEVLKALKKLDDKKDAGIEQ